MNNVPPFSIYFHVVIVHLIWFFEGNYCGNVWCTHACMHACIVQCICTALVLCVCIKSCMHAYIVCVVYVCLYALIFFNLITTTIYVVALLKMKNETNDLICMYVYVVCMLPMFTATTIYGLLWLSTLSWSLFALHFFVYSSFSLLFISFFYNFFVK